MDMYAILASRKCFRTCRGVSVDEHTPPPPASPQESRPYLAEDNEGPVLSMEAAGLPEGRSPGERLFMNHVHCETDN